MINIPDQLLNPEPEPEQINPLDDLTGELSILNRQRKKAIDNCDFSRARAIDCHMDRLKEDISDSNAKTEQIRTNLSFDYKKELIKVEAIKALTNTNELIFVLKSEYQEKLFSLHLKHSEVMQQFGEQYSAELEMAASRENPEYNLLIKQAKFNANSRNYGAAESIYQESHVNKEVVFNKRQTEVHDKFERIKENINEKHMNEVKRLKEKEASLIFFAKHNYKKYIANLKLCLAKTATELGIVLTPDDTSFLDDFIGQIASYESVQYPIDFQVMKDEKSSRTYSYVDENTNSENYSFSPQSSTSGKKRKKKARQTAYVSRNTFNRSLDCDLNHSSKFSRFSTPRK